MNNKFWIVLSHTYWSRFKTKSYMITTALILLFIIGLANVQSIMELFAGEDEADRVAVIDDTGTIFDSLVANLESTDSDIELTNYEGTVEEAKEEVSAGTFNAALHITMEDDMPAASYHSNQVSASGLANQLENSMQQIKIAMATNAAGIDQATIEQIYAPIAFETVMIQGEGDDGPQKSEEDLNSARGLVYVILFLLYFAVLTYGNMTAMDIANEKTSRVMEILISSSSPVSQMFAKILGIALLGLTQFGLIVIVGYVLIQQKKDEMVGGFFDYFGLEDIPVSTFIYAIVFFILGYLLYATLSAMLGSLVSRIEDVQQLMMPVIFLIIIAFMIAMFGLNAPETSFVKITSFIPFFTPLLMFLRVGMLDVPFWEVGLSIIIMVVTISILAVLGARVYKGGVLMYGRSTSLKDFKKALQLSKKE
ncbi:ABC transporter permease [Aquibacillus koreensis]|uniref:ABC transporter permease n=1 Tax=Aquibacillus koreensis TaxID=279446 RepID=A0A9X3WHR4_9BACI|nr:ABC transporter permease [Aquibacillus koreensis]MCT2535553.1 ABC transporter permease [Aquibacillus koreensis]MDC3420162.1 ABC transporter permease [Aquibacillus koreensis]